MSFGRGVKCFTENESVKHFMPKVPKFYGQLEITFKLTINQSTPLPVYV